MVVLAALQAGKEYHVFVSASNLKGPGTESVFFVQTLPSPGALVDGCGAEVDGYGAEVDGCGAEVDGCGAEVDGYGAVADGCGVLAYAFGVWINHYYSFNDY